MNNLQKEIIKKAFDVEVGETVGVTKIEYVDGVREEITQAGYVYAKNKNFLTIQFKHYKESVSVADILENKIKLLKEEK